MISFGCWGAGFRQGKEKRAAFAGPRLDPYPAAIELDDLLDQRQSHASVLLLIARREHLKQLENALVMPRLDAGAVVGDAELPGVAGVGAGDADASLGLVAMLDRVADQVLENLLQTGAFADHGRQLPLDRDRHLRRRRQ